MVDQIETAATAQRAVTSAAGEQSDVIATLQTAERYDHLGSPAGRDVSRAQPDR